MKSESSKYPRTMYLPWSPGLSESSQVVSNLEYLTVNYVVITEKLDGSNVCMTRNDIFARSHSGAPTHPSFDYAKALHAGIKYSIPENLAVFGEYCYAVHSIEYDELPSYFFVFGVKDTSKGRWTSWNDTQGIAGQLGFQTVPVLYRGGMGSNKKLQSTTLNLLSQPSVYGGAREGVVVRIDDHFSDSHFGLCVGKVVRANHVQTDEHWTDGPIRKQKLISGGHDEGPTGGSDEGAVREPDEILPTS